MDERGADRTPGDEMSLDAFYAAVPSAEELDLAEETGARRGMAEHEARMRAVLGDSEPGEPDPSPPTTEDEQEEASLTEGQARGILEHLLGAEPVDDEHDEDR